LLLKGLSKERKPKRTKKVFFFDMIYDQLLISNQHNRRGTNEFISVSVLDLCVFASALLPSGLPQENYDTKDSLRPRTILKVAGMAIQVLNEK
jgi:hypothetical protein